MSPLDALQQAYPGRFTAGAAAAWVDARRALLLARTAPGEIALSVSSGCAASGASTHARGMADAAAHALVRLDGGRGTTCEVCGATLPFERVDSVPTAVRCTSCAPASSADTRWCR